VRRRPARSLESFAGMPCPECGGQLRAAGSRRAWGHVGRPNGSANRPVLSTHDELLGVGRDRRACGQLRSLTGILGDYPGEHPDRHE